MAIAVVSLGMALQRGNWGDSGSSAQVLASLRAPSWSCPQLLAILTLQPSASLLLLAVCIKVSLLSPVICLSEDPFNSVYSYNFMSIF